MNLIQRLLARCGWRLTRIHPPAPPVWTIRDGLDFEFPPVQQASVLGPTLYTVTTGVGRWHVHRGAVDPDTWVAGLIGGTTPPEPDRLRAASAAEVIALLFKHYNPDPAAQIRRNHEAR